MLNTPPGASPAAQCLVEVPHPWQGGLGEGGRTASTECRDRHLSWGGTRTLSDNGGDRSEDAGSVLGMLLPWAHSSSGGFFVMLQGVFRLSQLLAWPVSCPLCGTSLAQPQEDGDLVMPTAQQRFLITQRRCNAVPWVKGFVFILVLCREEALDGKKCSDHGEISEKCSTHKDQLSQQPSFRCEKPPPW